MKKRFISTALAFVLFVTTLALPSSADSSADENGDIFLISASAGQHGMYEYDLETNTETYIPNDTPELFNTPLEKDFTDIESMLESLGKTPKMSDNRTAVYNPSGYEKSTCLLGARFSDNFVEKGTGFLINNRYLFTAAHIVYKPNYTLNGNKGYAKHVAVYPGASNGNKLAYKKATRYWIGGDYKANCSGNNYEALGMFDDWAVLELESSLSLNISYLNVRATNSFSDMKGKSYNSQGYPSELQTAAKWDDWTMYKVSGTINQVMSAPRFLPVAASDNIKISGGQSGSPLYRAGAAEAIAVASNSTTSCFILINEWLYNKVQELWSV
ncbi:MAG: trypsin-like peptidase domain-containing protein [Oscillospiraceae bacterium]|nr:trypsin-like peptidase domain-containing protein [Oscillospiraceae bacterium]